MAQKEDILWDILKLMHGNCHGWSVTKKGEEPVEHTYDHSYHINKLKGQLVLKHRPGDIEDTIYFMKHRGYFITHGQGMMAPEILYSLTDKALEVVNNDKLPEEEEKAFQEALWEIKPKLWGMGPNLSEWLKRGKKLKKRKQ